MSTEQKPGDPADKATDATADGAFGGVQTHNHRAGYGDDRLARLVDYLRRNPRATLASGEGALLLAEIDRLHSDLRTQADWADWANGEIDRLRDEDERMVQTLADFMIGKVSVKDIMVREGRMDIVMHTEMASVVANALAAILEDSKAENYVEMHMRGSDRKEYTVLVRRHEKPTPHEMRMRAEAERDRLTSILAALRAPSDAVIEWEDPAFPLTVADQDILAAVAAAEQEVGRE